MKDHYAQWHYEFETESWNYMQMNMKCCGVNGETTGPLNWENTTWWKHNKTGSVNEVPQSCCVDLIDNKNYTNPEAKYPKMCYDAAFDAAMPNRSAYVRLAGCENSLNDWFISRIGVLIIGTVVVIIIQVVVVVMACVLKTNIKTSYEHV
jgi:hypothetical protein